MSERVVDGVVVAEDELPARDLVPYAGKSLNLFGADSPAEVVEQAAEYATALADVIKSRKLYQRIGAKDHVLVEGWTLLASMLGVFAVLESAEPVDFDGVKGWRATVTAQTRGGDVVGRATALCLRSEERWRKAADYAVCSMAQTRATSKCLRGPLGFIIELAGFSPTPESEMPAEEVASPPAAPPPAADTATAYQHRKHNTMLKELETAHPQPAGQPTWTDLAREYCKARFGKSSRSQLTHAEMDQLIKWTKLVIDEEEIPFGVTPSFQPPPEKSDAEAELEAEGAEQVEPEQEVEVA